jgi:hypothetical protein
MIESHSIAGAALPGTCLTARATTLRCRIYELEESGCIARMETEALRHGETVELWIGALGPFRAAVRTAGGDNTEQIAFDEPLPRAILAHFLR